MAKNKRKGDERFKDSVAREQQQQEEGETINTASDEKDAETYEEEMSRAGNGRKARQKAGKGIINEEHVLEAAREAGDEPDLSQEKERNIGTQVIREARRKSQAAAALRTKRKEPSKNTSRRPAKSNKPVARKTSAKRTTNKATKTRSKSR
jgi:hypothetical protein